MNKTLTVEEANEEHAAEERTELAYHVTLREFLPSIRQQGLQPKPHESTAEPVIFVEPDQEEAEIYAQENTVTLRFPVDGFGCTDDGECVVHEPVPAESIEYFDQGRWLKLKTN